ncbi:LacI family DNA-binding transcriptional regulator [Bacillus vallismortis]|uniref:LacI family DNA-binding transcriptional regulator n=1 Tax=Bacillus vallismortis TaxID=72361 RepID=UPI00228327D2|nr:LacI family DNA-binding transcriptional regulator [Bacillus vallismortis]MCY8309697.1 LacI family transcriptional regulator [Bacillus vallismortis]MCY8598508.1 LacI family transcriptional regulator [Bacillus vallismortis]
MATIKDVAGAAGVSVATVSRVLNENGYVHEETRTRVIAAMERLNYFPNEVARSLYKRESRLIGLLLPDITNPFFPQLARGAEDELNREGYRLIFGNSDEELKKELEYLQTFKQNHVAGIIAATNYPDLEEYSGMNHPVVFLDRTPEGAPSVSSDGRTGGKLAAEAIIHGKSQRIALLRGPAHAQDRFHGALEALQQADVDFQIIETPSFAFKDAQSMAKELFAAYPETDGVIASNDIQAAAVLHEALRRGKNVPEDIQLIGYDDIPQSELLFPPLSTIKQPAYDMGKEAAKLLVRIIKKQPLSETAIQMPVTYIRRKTTRKEDHNA